MPWLMPWLWSLCPQLFFFVCLPCLLFCDKITLQSKQTSGVKPHRGKLLQSIHFCRLLYLFYFLHETAKHGLHLRKLNWETSCPRPYWKFILFIFRIHFTVLQYKYYTPAVITLCGLFLLSTILSKNFK